MRKCLVLMRAKRKKLALRVARCRVGVEGEEDEEVKEGERFEMGWRICQFLAWLLKVAAKVHSLFCS